MEIKPGYKQTEVGVIPEDWEVDTVFSTTPKNKSYGIVDGPFGSNLKTIHYRKSGIPIITSGYVTDGEFIADEYLYVDIEKFKKEKRSAVSSGDIVMAKIGARCGASAILPQWHETGILSGNTLKITVDETRNSSYYIWQILWNLYINGNIEPLKTVGAQPAISMANLKKFNIPLPPLPEQRAIAEVLSDVDGLISSLEKLIAKKRDIKQAAMQQLLTGKKRLPGFDKSNGKTKHTEVGEIPEDWEVQQISDIGDVKTGPFGSTLHESDYVLDGIPIITVEHLGEFGVEPVNVPMVSDEDWRRLKAYTLNEGDIVFSRVGSIDRNSLIRKAEVNWLFSGRLLRIRPRSDKVFPPYLSYHFHCEPFKQRVRTVAVGQTMASLNTQILNVIKVIIPPIPEQTAIATVLSDVDAEITALEKKRDKTRALKQGMMQELLTGKTRLM